MKRRLKKRYAFFTAIIALTAVMAVSVHSYIRSGKPVGDEPVEAVPPTPLNHLMENSMSDLAETEKFDAAIRRFMRYWDIKGASFALMKNDSLIYAKGYGFSNIQDSIECEVKNVFRVAFEFRCSVNRFHSIPLKNRVTRIISQTKIVSRCLGKIVKTLDTSLCKNTQMMCPTFLFMICAVDS
jgi:hypothetical protein